jgi:alpha-L-rhamnosidase
VTIRHAEVLDPDADGELYLANLRTAAATDTIVSTGEPEQAFEPRFTFHGFRYAEVAGVDALAPADVTARVLHSDTPWAGAFACSDPDVTQLWRNIAWGQRGNFLSVPTDCPQRDERLGWLADAQVFLPTATLNADVTAFFVKWLRDVRDAQSPDGAFSNVAPRIAGVADDGAPGWGDAGVLVPWHLYVQTGDERILADHLDAMVAWVDHVHRHNPDLIWRRRVGPHFADWLSIGPPTDRDLVATAYFARSARLTADAAAVLGADEEARRLGTLADAIAATFADRYVDADGRVLGGTQTGHALALAFGLVGDGLTRRTADHLADLVRDAGPAITTGFLGVGLLAGVLDDHGHDDLAHALLARREQPSWLYPVTQGATTIWERWDGYTDERGFQAPSMNSFNHYALGSVGEWLYAGVAGLAQQPGSVGWRTLRVRPRLGPYAWARAVHESPRGRVEVAWERDGGEVALDVLVPPGAEAVVHVPTTDPEAVREGGAALAGRDDVEVLGGDDRAAVARVGSGRWAFRAPAPPSTTNLTRTRRSSAGVTADAPDGG